ncbi:unnamed protein product [Rotaria sp. Silwood2]|nr:unnamed protein product [Rotaria sp. Silwood2]CAF2616188.1 unnamed protein product [Rotaria sp. Silwood2]CAF2893851.1 unnamed protein product [Rotaria sp. Silwood2]CAF3073955.1 unnamed protein product [Rotaria sp. Silwood2]CAF4003712.1 unnamed protein product [Rotaria sp. Silwood2]
MSSERSISPDPLPRSHSHPSVILMDGKDSNSRVARQSSSAAQKRRRDSSNRSPTPVSPRSPVSRSRSRSSIEGSKSPGVRKDTNQRSPSPPRQPSSSTKRRRHKDGADSGRHICEICSCDVETAKRLYGVLDNCDHIFCYECIVSWKRSKYSNAESESCPVCKVRSAFITPCKHWYDNKDDKYRIVKKHKNHLKTLPCRYYLRHGFCRYSDRCFYDHHEAAKQYRQQHQHSRDRDREKDRDRERDRDRYHSSHNGNRSHNYSPSPSPAASSRYSSSRYRERAY